MDQKTGLCTDGGRFQESSDQPVYDPQPSQPQTPIYGNFEAATADIIMPDEPLNIKGKFSYFGIKWDGHDLANAHENEVVRINTVKGYHNIEVRQVNSTFIGTSIARASFNVYVHGNTKFALESDGKNFDLKNA